MHVAGLSFPDERVGWSVILTVTLPATPYATRCYRRPDWAISAQYLAPQIRSGLGRLVPT
ncbi:hypothetical protein JCM18916_1261 [Cutibacterium acnes JCM 18916]|nr:hypothetical protein JCM18916_1261 [Cutibacterium acnes JCM 18916]